MKFTIKRDHTKRPVVFIVEYENSLSHLGKKVDIYRTLSFFIEETKVINKEARIFILLLLVYKGEHPENSIIKLLKQITI